jgi:Tfp pilus assembly protein PilO
MNRRVIAIGTAATFGLLAVWYLLLWSPQSASLKVARISASTALQNEASLKTQVAALQKQRIHLPALQAQLVQQQLAIPATPLIDKFLDQLNAAAIGSGVSVLSFSPTAPVVAARATAVTTPTTVAGAAKVTATTTPAVAVAASPATSIGLTLSVSGSYPQLVDFINRLTRLPRLTIVDGIIFAAPSDKAKPMSASITARVFEDPLAVTTTTTTTVGGH